jgi:hypothetical protein
VAVAVSLEQVVEVDDLAADLACTGVEILALGVDLELGTELLDGGVGAWGLLRLAAPLRRFGLFAI